MSVALARKIDERGALRAAIENASSTKVALSKAQASLEAATEHMARAGVRLRAAGVAVGKVREEHIERVANALGDGREPPSATSVQAARDAESEARDELDAARAAAEQIKSDIADLESDVAVAGRAVHKALAEMMDPACRALIVQVRARHQQFLRAKSALLSVAGLFDTWSEVAKEANTAANQPGFRLLHGDTTESQSGAVRQQWESALKALRENADAKLPDID